MSNGILTAERHTFALRLLAMLVIAVAYLLMGVGGNATWMVTLLTMYLVYVLSLHAFLPRWARPSLIYPMIVIDGIFLGLVWYWSGGTSPFILILFPLVVPFYAVYGAYTSTFFAATVMLVMLAFTFLVTGRAVLSNSYLTQVPLFYLLAALSGYLGQGRIRRLEEQEALQRLTRLEHSAQSLSGAVRTIQEALDLGVILQDLVDDAATLTGLPECLIALLDRKSGALVTRATTTPISRLGVDRLDYLVEWPREHSLVAEVLSNREPIALRHITPNDPPLPVWAERLKLEALLAVPLIDRGVDIGIIFFYGVPAGHPFTAEEVNKAQTFADIVALVAVNAQLYEDVQVTISSVMSELRPIVLPRPSTHQRRLEVIEVGDLTVDVRRRQARIRGRPISLTPTEFDLLAVLAESSGRAVDQETLLRRVWGEDYNGRSTVVDVGMHRLRRKIENGSGSPRRIITVRGSGYMLVPASDLAQQGDER